MENIFKEQSEKIKVYLATENETDPFEHTVDTIQQNSMPCSAIVTEVEFSKSRWVLPGIITEKVMQIIVEKKRRSLLEQSYKIEIDGEDFYGWKLNGRMQLKREGNYIRCYVYKKKETE